MALPLGRRQPDGRCHDPGRHDLALPLRPVRAPHRQAAAHWGRQYRRADRVHLGRPGAGRAGHADRPARPVRGRDLGLPPRQLYRDVPGRAHVADEPGDLGDLGDLGEASQEQIDQRFYAIIADLVGTPAELVAPDGTLAGCQQHTLWGTTVWCPDGAQTPLRFPGQYADPETGLHYNQHRYYDPVAGSYLTPDPLGLAAAPNPHAYVPNPQVLADPLGTHPIRAHR